MKRGQIKQLKETNVKDSYLAGRRQDQLGSLQQGTDMFVEPAVELLKKYSDLVKNQIEDEVRQLIEEYKYRINNSVAVPFLDEEKDHINDLIKKLNDEYESYSESADDF